MEQYLIFRLADEYYGLLVSFIENIEKMMPITRVPNTKEYIKGVVNLRGEIVPVIDLREKIGVKKEEFGEETRILIVNWKNEFKVGLIIDEVLDVVYLTKEDFDSATRDRNEFTFSIAKYNNVLINIINLEDVLFEKVEEV
ncbi:MULTISPECIES: chemotaxis protein CheW [unclassified Caldicellulosiruptor]|uniref:chemotaxis protein CheW n=1 Tax=unclassified Caldicellulosiruptor TaxID=2622462 RepID=UPI00039F0251|nr:MULTISPECIES: chemotaxis protein CheW [unclassified Caldicellulosiruptor]